MNVRNDENYTEKSLERSFCIDLHLAAWEGRLALLSTENFSCKTITEHYTNS